MPIPLLMPENKYSLGIKDIAFEEIIACAFFSLVDKF